MGRNTKLVLLTAMLSLPVFANDVGFETEGVFCYTNPCNSGNSFLSVGGGQDAVYLQANGITYVGNTGLVPLITIGIFDVGVIERPIIGIFQINIGQLYPSIGNGEFQGELSGNFAVGGNNAEISFSQPSLMIGNVIYTLQNQDIEIPTFGAPIYLDDILATVSEAPEPSFFGLVGLGLIGIGWMRRKHES